MVRTRLMGVACIALLWAGSAVATSSPQESCDNVRITAWAKYRSCVNAVLAKDAKGIVFDELKSLSKCRDKYSQQWSKFQAKASLQGSACVGDRFTDNGDQTITDNLSGLTWEAKTIGSDEHNRDNTYSWSAVAPYAGGNGAAYAAFLFSLNYDHFALTSDWRIPSVAELQTLLATWPLFLCTGAGGGQTCQCLIFVCIEITFPDFLTNPTVYWSATTYAPDPTKAWGVDFNSGLVGHSFDKSSSHAVRAVRGGW